MKVEGGEVIVVSEVLGLQSRRGGMCHAVSACALHRCGALQGKANMRQARSAAHGELEDSGTRHAHRAGVCVWQPG
jgi:hypothetical protein